MRLPSQTKVPFPLSTAIWPVLADSSSTAARRSSCIAAELDPSRRAASPGWGVKTLGDRPLQGRDFSGARRFKASASSTPGTAAVAIARRTCTPPALLLPKPGPRTIAVAPSRNPRRLSTLFRVVAAGTATVKGAIKSAGKQTRHKPTPPRRAPRAVKIAAPNIPALPARTVSVPKLPLWPASARLGNPGILVMRFTRTGE